MFLHFFKSFFPQGSLINTYISIENLIILQLLLKKNTKQIDNKPLDT